MTAEIEVDDSPKPNIVVHIKRKLSSLVQIEVEPVGKWFHCYEHALVKSHHTSDGEHLLEDDDTSEEEEEEETVPDVEIKDDITYLRSLDPADWKNQDHYTVLGLKKYRHKATDEDIKKAYRMMVLRHHPDKRAGSGLGIQQTRDDDDYFTCITRAYEVLGTPARRRAYDSVDPEFDDDIPTASEIKKGHFFEVFSSVIERNARWSTRRHVPLLGKPDDSKLKVDKFYNFWYDFDSWREFSYLDEEDKEKGQDREERRWIEKQNKVERARRRKEEMTRMRKLVDSCYNADPRVAKFKEEEREKKLAIKKAKQDAIRQKQEEEERIRREAEDRIRAAKEAEEAEAKAKTDAEKREREAVKKALKKERKVLRCVCKDRRYFAEDETERVQLMTDVELLCEALQTADLHALNQRLSAETEELGARNLLLQQVADVKARIEEEREEVHKASLRSSAGGSSSEGSTGKKWSLEDIQLLIKAVNLFPAGTSKRWEVVAEYLNQHSTHSSNRVAKEVLSKAKELQNSEHQMKEAAKKTTFQTHAKNSSSALSQANSEMTPSVRLETPQEMLGVNLSAWSAEEQRLLEQALKTFPTSTADRWDKIADCLPNRSKKDCMKRYKELVEMVKAKKAAQAAAEKK